ncbi:Hypothetical predicted protein [Mytilus galloprovincialis]|uniref:Reverse transcriptase domain-containing protein n=1 Tax=Mytilus galloprovincialis TaxID=29158 RepID=A0A8B6FFK6_MYTGA|nr:Hypothetical predicted protein [Mytilus galloprovincialis]
MDSLNSVLNLVQKGDWAISLDLKDAYFHIPIHETHKKYLRFCVNNQCYQFRVLCFGPTSAPRIFTKVCSVVAAHLRAQNIRLATYLDDWFLLNQTKKNADFRSRENAKTPNKFRICSKSRKVKPNSNTINNIHRSTVFSKRGNGSSYIRKGVKTPFCSRTYLKQAKSSNSKRFSTIIRYYGFMHRINSKCKTLYETNSVTPPLSLETSLSKSRNKNSFFETSKRSPQMVVKNRKFGHRQINKHLGKRQ